MNRRVRAAIGRVAAAALVLSFSVVPGHGPAGFARAASPQGSSAAAPVQAPDPSAALRAQYSALRERLEHSPFQQGLYLESSEQKNALQGDVYARVDYPFAVASEALATPAHWCDLLILHLNVKYCSAYGNGHRTVLSVALGRKFEQPLGDTYRFEFTYSVAASRPDYFEVHLDADKGPLGTHNYRIALRAVAIEGGRSFLHLRYSYAYGFEGRWAMDAYLATTGSGKVGFTTVKGADGRAPQFIGGVRGAIERNTMRYYLAIDAYLGALAAPPAQRFEQSLVRWFDGTERYARQLHEVDRNSYLRMKRREYLRQQTLR